MRLKSIYLFACCEKNKLKSLRHFRQKLPKVRAGSNKDLVLCVLKNNWKREAGVLESLQGAVDKRLVQINDK